MGGETRPAVESLAARADPERLKQRSGWRLLRAHPAVGLAECEDGDEVASDLRPHELGVRWLALSSAEQRAREHAFVRALLGRVAGRSDAAFEAGWPGEVARTEALARHCGASFTASATARGVLDATAVDALLDDIPPLCSVVGGDELVIDLAGLPRGMTVWMDRWKAPELQAELLDCVHHDAEARMADTAEAPELRRRQEADRTLRAHVLVVWSRHSSKPISLAFGLIALLHWHPLGEGWAADLVVAIVVAVAAMLALERLVSTWYERGG